MKIVTTFDGIATVCNVTSWPPTSVQGNGGWWELGVWGESSNFDLLNEKWRGCSFKVGKFELCNLLFVRRKAFPPVDEMEFSTMVFAKIVNLETGVSL